MKQSQLDEMKDRYKLWANKDLIRAITIEKDNYRPEAYELLNEELNSRNLSQLDLDRIRAEVNIKVKDEIETVSGIKGFLLFFVLVVAGNSIYMFLSGLSSFLNYLSFESFVVCFPIIGIGLYGMCAFILLLLKKTNAPKHAAYWIICSAVYTIIVSVLSYFTSGDVPSVLIGTCVFSLIWLTYLSSSKRVEVTYGCKSEPKKTPKENGKS